MKHENPDNAPFIIEGTLTNLHYERCRANPLAQVETHYKRNAVVTGVGAVVGDLFGQASNAAMLAMYDGEETQNLLLHAHSRSVRVSGFFVLSLG